MTLCQNSKTKYFGRLFLAFVMLLGGVFFTTSESKAEYDYSVPTFNENVNFITIPEYTGEAVLICYNSDGFTIDSSNSTQMAVDLIDGYDNQTVVRSKNLAYFENPNIGSQAWAGTNKCILVKNYDSNKGITLDRLYNKYPSCNSSFSFSTSTPEIENDFIIGIFNTNNDYRLYGELEINNGNVLISEKEQYWDGSNYANNLFISTTTEPINNLYSFSVNGAGCITGATVYRLNIGQQTAPPSNDYVMYYGANPVYTKLKQPYNFPVVFNVCENYASNSAFYRLRLNKDDNTYQDSGVIGTDQYPCSGRYTFSELAPNYEDSGTAYFTIYDDNGNTVATSSEFLYTNYIPVNQKGNFINANFDSPIYADYFTATSTELSFSYDVCFDENFNNSTQICIDHLDTTIQGVQDYNKTEYCQTLTTCKGTTTIPFPIGTTDMTAYFRASYYETSQSDFTELFSDPFMFILYNSDAAGLTNIFSTSTIHNLVCSNEEWNTPDPAFEILGASVSMPALNLTKLKCGTFETTLNILNSIANGIKFSIQGLVKIFTNIFPFNFATKILECWKESEFQTLPTELSAINILDENGNVKINLPSEWAENSSITMWGKEAWEATPTLKTFFNFFRTLTKYSFWAIFIFGIWNAAHDIYDEIMAAKIRKRNDDVNYQR